MQFSLTDLRLFVAVAELSNLTRAADRCNLSLPAASARIRKIESQASCRLFERHAHGVSLTAAGDVFARYARTVLLETDTLGGALGGFAGGLQGHVTMLANTTAVTELMPVVLARFLVTHPQVSVSLKEQANPEIARAVREGRADLGVLAGDIDLTGLSSVHFATDRLVLVAPRGHRLARRAKASYAEVIAHPTVSLHDGSTINDFLARRVEAMGLPPVRPRVQVNSFEALCLMVEAGVGLGIAPESVARRYQASMKIRLVPLAEPWAVRERHVVVRDIERAPIYLRDLVGSICAHGGDVVPQGDRTGTRLR
jgi:DNA-binding transcriptional LysR family regulator